MEFRSANHNERDEVLDLLALWYNDREFFARYNQLDPTFRDDLCLVARDGSRLVSTVQIFDRPINLGGHTVPMGGIGSVFTREEYRHKGVASALMRLAVDTMIRNGFEVSLLFAERLTFYNQFGWREVDRKFSILPSAASLRPSDNDHDEWDRFEIDSFEEARDLPEIAAIHRAYTGRFNVTAVRDDSAWRANLRFAGNQPLRPGEGSEEYFPICRTRDGRIAAYARITRFHGVSMVMEFGYLPIDIEAMLAIFKYLAEEAASTPLSFRRTGDHTRSALLRPTLLDPTPPPILVTHTAHDPALEDALTKSGCPIAHHTDNNYMWQVLNPERLATRLGISKEIATTHAFKLFADSNSLFWTADRF
jgi:predicted N-acetyltransferase YhbS